MNAVALPKFYEYLNKYFATKFQKLPKISASLENNSWQINKRFELNILGFEPLVAKVWNPSEWLMQSKIKYGICICSICLVFQDYSCYIVHKVCFNLLSCLLYRFSIFHNKSSKSTLMYQISYWQLHTGNINWNIFVTCTVLFVYNPKFLKLISICERKNKFTQKEGNKPPLVSKYKYCFHYHYWDHLKFINLLQAFQRM